MEDSLRKDITAAMVNGRLSANAVTKLMRVHKIGRKRLWEHVKEVQSGEIVKDASPKKRELKNIDLHTDIQYAPVSVDAYDGLKQPDYVADESVLWDKQVNPFVLLRARRAWKRVRGEDTTKEELLGLQRQIISGEIEVETDLASLILQL